MVILIKDHFGFYEILNIKLYQDESLMDQQGIYGCIQDLQPGIYKMKIICRQKGSGQYGEYSMCEVPPYYYVSKAKFTKISSIDKQYKTPQCIKTFLHNSLRKKLDNLSQFVSKQSTEDKKYILFNNWGNKITFAYMTDKNSWMRTSILNFQNKLTNKNIKMIKTAINQYFNNKEAV